MDVRDNTAAGDCSLDQRVQLLVTTNGQVEMARRHTLHLQVFGRIA